nr:transposase [Pseudorhodobacter turbinis]
MRHGHQPEREIVTGVAPFRKSEWVVYAKPPFGGPGAVLAYLSRYTQSLCHASS